MNTPVSFPLARLLKDKNIHILSAKSMYASNGELTDAVYDFDNWCFAPTISDVVMWLYEKHGIWIDVNITRYGKFWGNVFLKEEYNDLKNPFNWEFVNQIIDFNSPTEAYEAAIEYTLNNLI